MSGIESSHMLKIIISALRPPNIEHTFELKAADRKLERNSKVVSYQQI